MDINYQLTKKQKAFIDATEDEVLYGGAMSERSEQSERRTAGSGADGS